MAGDGLKHDSEKVRLELIDLDAELALGMVLTAGALEYKDHGWLRLNTPEGRNRIIGSLRRHLRSFQALHQDDVAIDEQFGLPHSAHFLACAMFLCAFDVMALVEDDRWDREVKPNWQTALRELREKKAGEEAKRPEGSAEAFTRFLADFGPSSPHDALAGMRVSGGSTDSSGVDRSTDTRSTR